MSQKRQLLLIGESFSPWAKKARWALEFCQLAYDYKEYTPTLSEPGLRWRLKQWSGTVSVPVLFSDHQILRGSWEIARYANEVVGDERLGDLAAITYWNDLSEAALAEGRTQVVRRILGSTQALEEAVPSFVPQGLRRSLRFMAHDAVQRLDRKYAHLVQPGALREALVKTREGLARSNSDYLLGQFTYADMAMAVVVEVFAPIAHTHPPLGPATEQSWNNAELAEEFEDLVFWRDRLAATATTSYSQFADLPSRNSRR